MGARQATVCRSHAIRPDCLTRKFSHAAGAGVYCAMKELLLCAIACADRRRRIVPAAHSQATRHPRTSMYRIRRHARRCCDRRRRRDHGRQRLQLRLWRCQFDAPLHPGHARDDLRATSSTARSASAQEDTSPKTTPPKVRLYIVGVGQVTRSTRMIGSVRATAAPSPRVTRRSRSAVTGLGYVSGPDGTNGPSQAIINQQITRSVRQHRRSGNDDRARAGSTRPVRPPAGAIGLLAIGEANDNSAAF